MFVCAIALWRGRDQERLAAAAVLAGWALSMVVFKQRSEETQWAVLGIDICIFALFAWISLRSARFWPLFTAGFGLLLLATHGASALDSRVSGWAYLTAERIWSYLTILAIGYGAWTAPRRYAEIEAYGGGPDLLTPERA
jgi:hypothetical protein